MMSMPTTGLSTIPGTSHHMDLQVAHLHLHRHSFPLSVTLEAYLVSHMDQHPLVPTNWAGVTAVLTAM